MTKIRIGFWALLLLSGVIILHKLDKNPVRGHVGRVVACSGRFPFRDSQAEILEFGLKDVRGLAWDRQKNRVFISESNRSLLVDWLDSDVETSGNETSAPNLELTEAGTVCPEASCGAAAERGLAILDGRLFSAEHGRGQILVRNLPPARFKKDDKTDEGAAWLLSASALPGDYGPFIEPSGIAATDDRLFITDEPLRAVPTPEVPAFKVSASKTSTTKGLAANSDSKALTGITSDSKETLPQSAGVLYVCLTDKCAPEPISLSLHHPSGVAAETAKGPVIVADTDGHEVRWPVYEKLNEKWRETRLLGSVPISGEALPAFLGIALDDSRKMVFAAGPGGLYVFDLDGTLLGRIMFDDPVTAVATGGNYVYLTIGNSLCALRFNDSPHPLSAIDSPPKATLNDPGLGILNAPAEPDQSPPAVENPRAKGGLPRQQSDPTPFSQVGTQPHKKKSHASGKQQNCICSAQKPRS